jgi:hypothetical protein
MYVCMYVRVYVCMYVCICIYVCVYVCKYVCIYVCMDVRMYPSVLSRFPRLDFRFRDICVFYGERSSASHPTPNLEDEGISFSLDHPLQSVRLG